MRHNRLIILGVSVIIIAFTPFSFGGTEGNVKSTFVSERIQTQELREEEEPIINIVLDDWKTYRESQYVPPIDNQLVFTGTSVVDNKDFDKYVVEVLKNEKINSEYFKILNALNPYKTRDKIYRSNIDLAYGITQINVKLIPLAKLYYSDFESNKKSQLLFLNDYINKKISKGIEVEHIIQQYKYCDYN